MSRVYSWRKHHDADAQAVGEWLSSLSDLSDENIVKLSKRKTCPAHPIIWGASKGEAEYQYRLLQARVMRRSLKVEIVSKQQEVVEVDAFVTSVRRGGHVPIFEADEDELSAYEQRFLLDIERLERRYSNLTLAHQVINAIRSTRKSAARRKKAA